MGQGEVGDRIRATADIVQSARADVLSAHVLAADARDGLAHAMEGADPDAHAEVVGALTNAVSATNEAADFAGALSASLTAFADRIGSGGSGAASVVPVAVSEPVRPVAAKALPPPGRWKGKTATEHVLSGGVDIGRPAKGSKAMPTQLVDTAEEVHEIFTALSVGAVLVDKPRYVGRFYRLPDGTTIGYRTKSRSGGDNDPTLDLGVRGDVRAFLKIHIAHEGE